MCGIFGIFSTSGRPLPRFDEAAVLASIRHRGPDDEGVWRDALPEEVLTRRKKPFLAPFGTPFAGARTPDYVRELLADRTIERFGYFDPQKVRALRQRLTTLADSRGGAGLAVPSLRRSAMRQTIDGMALVFVLSVHLLEHIVRTTGYRSFPADLSPDSASR